VPAELLQLGVKLRLVPVRPADCRPQVVDHQLGRHAAEVPEGVLKGPQKGLGILLPDRLAVGLAREAQHHPEHPGVAAAAVLLDHGSAAPEVHLRFLAGAALHAPERHLASLLQLPHEPLHRLVAALEGTGTHQVLPDALRRQPLRGARLDESPVRGAQAAPADPARIRGGWFCFRGAVSRTEPGGRNGSGWRVLPFRAGGRNGWFCAGRPRGLPDRDVAPDRSPVQTQLAGDATTRPPALIQRDNRLLHSHFQLVRHIGLLPEGSRTDTTEFSTFKVAGFEVTEPGWF